MKKLTTLLLLLSNLSFAQTNPEQGPSQFDNFIIKPEIEWAAYMNDTFRFTKPDLNKLLVTRFDKDEIKGAYPVTFGINNKNKIIFSKKIPIDKRISSPNELPIYDSTGNVLSITKQATRIKIPESSLTDITEILYIEKAQLKSYVPLVSPTLPVVTSLGILLGHADYFSTCFNFDCTYQTGKQNKIEFLSRTNRNLLFDSIKPEYRLKELYGRNLLQTLWPNILQDRFEIISIETNKRIKSKDLTGDLINDVSITVPVYDSLGNISGSKVLKQELSVDSFTKAELIQDWYYDFTKNIVFNKPRELYLYAFRMTIEGIDKQVSPILKIVFK